MTMPVHKVPSALVYNAEAGQVDTVIIDGQIVMRNKQITVVDEKQCWLGPGRCAIDYLNEPKR